MNGSRFALFLLLAARLSSGHASDEVLLTAGQPIEAQASTAEPGRHSLIQAPGEYVRLAVERVTCDVSVRVVDAEDATLTEADTQFFVPGSLSFSLVAPAGGTRRLEVRPAGGHRSGTYRITLVERRPSEPSDLDRVAAERAYFEGERLRIEGTGASLRRAAASYDRARSAFQGLGDLSGEADALTGAARVRDALNERDAALAGYGDVLARYRALGRDGAAAYVLNFRALVHDHLGNRGAALRELEQAMEVAPSLPDPRVLGVTLNNLGMVQLHLGDKVKALDFLEKALPAHRAAGNLRVGGSTLHNIGTVYDSMGHKARALDYFRQALPLRRAVGDLRDLASTLNNIGVVHFSIDALPEAIAAYGEALVAWRGSGDRSGEAATLQNMARVHEAAGEYQAALSLYQQVLPIFRETRSRVREANALSHLGRLHASLGDHTRALSFYEEALLAHREAGNRQYEAATLSAIGSSHAALGDPSRALTFYEQALPLRRAVSDRSGEAATMHELGRAWAALGRSDEAREAYERALALYREVGNRRWEATTLVDLARVRTTAEAASEALEQAVAVFRALGDRRGEAAALFARARRARDLDDLDSARTDVAAAIERVESLRTAIASRDLRSTFLATVQDYYELHVDLLLRLHARRPQEGFAALALGAAERGRARSLLEALSEARAGINEGVAPALLERERVVQRTLNAKAARQAALIAEPPAGGEQASRLAREIDATTAELQAVQAEIRATSPRYAALTQPQPLSAQAIVEDLLDDQTLLLEYATGAERSHLWAVTRRSLAAYELPGRAVLEDAARRLHQALSAGPGGSKESAAAEMARLLLAPVAQDLERWRRLVVVGDGALQTVSFAALPGPGNGRPLVLDHELVMLPSASTLAALRTESAGRPAASRTVAVLADPVFDGQDPRVHAASRLLVLPPSPPVATRSPNPDSVRGGLARLIGSRREAAAIVRAAGKAGTSLALDFEASRRRATSPELAGYRIVHFATHGILDDARPELSGIVLSLVDAQGRSQDGFLRLHEVYNLRLGAELVVLSACQTALGRQVRGEGLVGLVRGFMYAGAPRVMATLWKVDDRATTELMRRFYGSLLGPARMSPAAALRAAQARLARDPRWRDPYHWAGFVLQGEWR